MNTAIATRLPTEKKSSYEQELLLKIQDYETTQQRLFTQLKTHEEENNVQKDQLDEAHQQIRKLESENLNLRFEIFELKRKQKDLSTQLEKSKNLHNSSGMNDSCPQSPCLSRFDSKIFDSEVKSYGRQFQVQSEGLGISRLRSMNSEQQLPRLSDDEAPKDISSPLSLNSPQRPSFGRSQSFMEPPHPLSERRLNSQKSQIFSPQSNKENLNDGNRRKSSFFKEAIKNRLHHMHTQEEIPESATKRKYSRTLTRKLSDDYQTSYADEPSEILHPQFKRMRSYSCDFSEEQNYLTRFNALSENIVSLGVTPQIAMNEWGNEFIQEESQSQPHAKHKVEYISKDHNLILSEDESEPRVDASGKSTGKQKNLFENFLVLGVENNDIKTYTEKHPEKKSGVLPPKVLFQYPEEDLCPHSQAILKTISDFVFAFGVQISKLRASPSFSALNPIIYASANEDVKSKCFVFPLLSNDQFGNALPLGEIVHESNPNKLLYFVCFLMRDFVTLTDQTKRRKTIKDINYWKTYKVMCFMTYYPLANFFFDVLTKLQEILKIERMMEISHADTQDLAYHQNVDETLTAKFFTSVVKKNLKELLEKKNLEFSTSLEFKLKGNFIELNASIEVPEKSKAYLMESDWAYPTVFYYFPLKDLLWLFSAMMLERKLVFFSKNLYLLTSSLSALSSLLKPFKYPYPMIFNLPDVLFPLCDAPGAALIGINKGEDYLKNSGLFEEYPSCIFICLDEEKFYLEKTPHKEIPALESFEKALLKSYHKLNSNLMRRLVDANKSPNYIPKPKKIKYSSNNDDKNNCIEICQVFKEKLHEKVISFIPTTPIYQDADKNLDIKKIGKKVVDKAATSDKEFVIQFVQTQIFMYYLEQIYHHK